MAAPAHRRVALCVIAAAVVMGGMSYAAVPLYQAFCKATGYGGTTQTADAAPAARGTRRMTVRFDANVAPGLDWSFEPETASLELVPGETATVFYKVRNLSKRAGTATAVYNVTPDVAGAWFDKISCFCFTEQRLDAGESADLPVVFFLDPALERDETMDNVRSLTLSYTFYAPKAPARPVASIAPPKL